MAVYGLTTDGLVVKTLNIIRDELNTRLRDAFGASIKLDDRAVLGQIAGIISEVAALIWELVELVNSSQDPDKATGAALDALCTLTGTFRPAASFSTVTLTLTGTPTTVVPDGSFVLTESTDVTFETTAAATITALTAWANATVYNVGDRRTNAGNAYQCTTAGTSSIAPTGEAATIAGGGTLVWTFLGNGTGAVDVAAQGAETGPLEAAARDLIVIDTQISGWNDVINLLDATPGRAVASDEELRLLRDAELAGAGNTPVDALRADLLAVEDVLAVTVFVNNTDATNADGMPPHSVEALVRAVDPLPSGFDQSIWDALLANVAAGIQTHGLQVGTATDSQGTAHTMKFNRPTSLPIYIRIGVVKDPAEYPADGDTLIKDAIVEWGDDQLTGKDAVPSSIVARAFEVDGVLSVSYVAVSTAVIATPTTWAGATAYGIGNTVINSGRVYRCTTGGTSAASGGPSATGTGITDGTVVWSHLGETIAVSLRELAVFDTSRITVVSTSGVP